LTGSSATPKTIGIVVVSALAAGAAAEGGHGNHSNATADELGHERRQAIVLTLQPMIFDHHVLALDVAGFVEAFTERSSVARGGFARTAADEADDWHRGLLRAHRERPRRRTADERDELASQHIGSHAQETG